jgi:hypothetical protein
MTEIDGVIRGTIGELCIEREIEVLALLARPWWHPRRVRDPERRKILARFMGCVAAARTLASRAVEYEQEDRIRSPLSHNLTGRDLDGMIELIDILDQVLLEVGDERFLRAQHDTELFRSRRILHMGRPDSADPYVAWHELHPDDTEPSDVEAIRYRLASIRWLRTQEFRLSRARLAMRRRALLGLAPVLLALIAATTVVLVHVDQGPTWSLTLLVSLVGALGGTTAGAYKLRDNAAGITGLRGLEPALIVQPLLGACAGLVMLLILVSGFLPQEAADSAATPVWAKDAVAAFVAGFSEPFFLGVVGRVGSGPPPERSPGRARNEIRPIHTAPVPTGG